MEKEKKKRRFLPWRKAKETEKDKDPNQKEYSIFQNMMYTMKGAFRFDKSLAAFMLLVTLTVVAGRYIPTFALSAIIACITEQAEFSKLLSTVLFFCGIKLLASVLQAWGGANDWWRMIYARMRFMILRVRKVLYMDYEYIESAKMMELCQKAMRATNDNNSGIEGMIRSFQSLMTLFASGFAGIAIIGRLSPWIIVLLIAIGLLNFVNMDMTKRYDKKIWDELAPYWRKEWYMQQTMTNFVYGKDIRLFSMKRWLIGKYKALNILIHSKIVRSKNHWIVAVIINNILAIISECAVYVYLVHCVLENEISIAEFSLYFGAIATFRDLMQQIFNSVTDLKNQSRAINDFRTFLEYPEREIILPESGEAPALSGQKEYRFVFENVSFRYPESDKYALKNLNLTLEAGERLAVVGLNGAGKSTFIKLLCGLYTPTEGRILLNGVDIRAYDKREFYELFAPVFQNVELFAFPMDENVSMKMADETDSALAEKHLRAAGLGSKIDELEHGVKTELLKVISEEGIDLSGGERQKLAFARALYKDAPVVVLDEPTSALDALAEYEMYQNFDKMIGKKSAVYISHRLSSTRFCDHVALFADGELKEYGTHESLLAQGGAYREMFDVQAQYYREGGALCE